MVGGRDVRAAGCMTGPSYPWSVQNPTLENLGSQNPPLAASGNQNPPLESLEKPSGGPLVARILA
jgi:hypothetical protein